MSRTKKGSKPSGFDFGSRYNCNKNYAVGIGKTPKKLANKERRKMLKIKDLINNVCNFYNIKIDGAYEEGVKSFNDGVDISDCPYKDEINSQEWKHGWVDAYVETK